MRIMGAFFPPKKSLLTLQSRKWAGRGNAVEKEGKLYCTVVQSWTRQEFGLSFVFVSFPSSLKSLLSSSFPPSLTIPRPPTNQPTNQPPFPKPVEVET